MLTRTGRRPWVYQAPVPVENARTPPFHAATPSRRPHGEGSQRKKGGFPPHGQTASAHWSCEFEERSAAAGGLRCRDPPHTSRARAAFRACAITPPETPVCPSRLSCGHHQRPDAHLRRSARAHRRARVAPACSVIHVHMPAWAAPMSILKRPRRRRTRKFPTVCRQPVRRRRRNHRRGGK